MDLKISRILHAGYLFEYSGTKVAFDTIFENPFSRNCYAFPAIEFDHDQIQKLQFDAVFISHFHDDHCSFESLNYLDRKTPLYVFCVYEELFALIKQMGFVNIHSLDLNVPIQVGSITITPRRALDADVDSIFHVQAAGMNVLNVVDSWIDYDTLDLLSKNPWDLILWPFQTMREIEVIAPSRARVAPENLPPEWMEQLQTLNPRFVVPSSCQFVQEEWSWYNHAFFPVSYKQFATEVRASLPSAEIVRLNPGTSVTLSEKGIQKSTPLPWITPVGNQEVDYDYQKNLKPPPTSEIAKRFPALSAEQRTRIYSYCETGLIEKYTSMDAPQDPYFDKPRKWRLSVYDHTGTARDFYFELNGNQITKSTPGDLAFAWCTEIPEAKFYAALELGESLTSMYMRINDFVFAPEIEQEIQDADIVEDPLIRCLFTGTFGSYQIAQLKRLGIKAP